MLWLYWTIHITYLQREDAEQSTELIKGEKLEKC